MVLIRPGREDDVPALTAIYNHYVLTEAATFDLEPHRPEDRLSWFSQFSDSGRHRIFVADESGLPVGYAYSGKFRDRPAYATSIETSVYVAERRHGRGIGRALYEALFRALENEDIHRAFAGVTQPNEHSMRLHRAFGFVETGIFQVSRS